MANDQPDHLAQSITSLMRRTQRSLSPWAQRALATAASAPPSIARRPMAIAATRTTSLVSHIQRTADRASALHFERMTNSAAAIDQFAERVMDRFPPIAQKYEARPTRTAPQVQRSPLPLLEQAAPEFVPDSTSLASSAESFTPSPFASTPASTFAQREARVQRDAVATSEDIDRTALPSITDTLRQMRTQVQRKPDAAAETQAQPTVTRSEPPRARRAQISEVMPQPTSAGATTRADQAAPARVEAPIETSRPSPRQLARTIGQLRPFIQRQADETSTETPPAPIRPQVEDAPEARVRRFTQTVQREAQEYLARTAHVEGPPSAPTIRRKIEEITPATNPSLPLRRTSVEHEEPSAPVEASEASTPIVQRSIERDQLPAEPPIVQRAVERDQLPTEPLIDQGPSRLSAATQRAAEPKAEPARAPIENLSTELPLQPGAPSTRTAPRSGASVTSSPSVPVQRELEPPSAAKPDELSSPITAVAQRAVESANRRIGESVNQRTSDAGVRQPPVNQASPGLMPLVQRAAESTPDESTKMAEPSSGISHPTTPVIQRKIESTSAHEAEKSEGASQPMPTMKEVMPLHGPSSIQRAEETTSPAEAPTSERPASDFGERVLKRAMSRTQQPAMGQPTPLPAIVQRAPQRGESPTPQPPRSEESSAETSAGSIEPPVTPVRTSTSEMTLPHADEPTARPSITRLLRDRIARAAESPSTPASESEAAPVESTSLPRSLMPADRDESGVESPTAQPIKRAAVAPATSTPVERASSQVPSSQMPSSQMPSSTSKLPYSELPLVTRVMRKPSSQAERSSGEETPAPRSSVPLPPVRSTSAPKIQRTIETSTATISRTSQPVVQRAEGEATASNEPARAPAVDLDQLARDVYPYLRRLIAVERERGG
jgi:hypothetical protein